MAKRGKPVGHQLDLLVDKEWEIQAQEAIQANAVWYYSRTMCQIALPSSSFEGREFIRSSGAFNLVVQTLPPLHVPWGIYPRGILSWITTEIVRKKNTRDRSRVLELGSSLAEFMEKVSGSKTYSGGKTGNIRPFKQQLSCLFGSRIAFWIGEGKDLDITKSQGAAMQIGSAWNLMWHPRMVDQPGLVQSTIQIGEEFYEDCLRHGVPIDVRIVRGLWPNCMAFDLYVWLTYRANTLLSYGRHTLELSWPTLKMQFGFQYATPWGFRWKFLDAMRRVRFLYQDIEFQEQEGKGVIFRFKRPSVSRISAPGLPQLPHSSTHK